MICPACGSELTALDVKGVVVDVCRYGCGGVWFDNFEFGKVDAADDKLGEALANCDFVCGATVTREKRQCPRCGDITMLQHQFSREKQVIVDECANCGGVWLDGGELAEIRRPVSTREDRRRAAQRFFNHLFVTEMAELRMKRARS